MPNHKAYQHHCRAAEHHDHAAKHHRRTAKLFSEGLLDQAAEQAQIAHKHHVQAAFHSEEATRARYLPPLGDEPGPGYLV